MRHSTPILTLWKQRSSGATHFSWRQFWRRKKCLWASTCRALLWPQGPPVGSSFTAARKSPFRRAAGRWSSRPLSNQYSLLYAAGLFSRRRAPSATGKWIHSSRALTNGVIWEWIFVYYKIQLIYFLYNILFESRRQNNFQLIVALGVLERESTPKNCTGLATGDLYLDDSISQGTV